MGKGRGKKCVGTEDCVFHRQRESRESPASHCVKWQWHSGGSQCSRRCVIYLCRGGSGCRRRCHSASKEERNTSPHRDDAERSPREAPAPLARTLVLPVLFSRCPCESRRWWGPSADDSAPDTDVRAPGVPNRLLPRKLPSLPALRVGSVPGPIAASPMGSGGLLEFCAAPRPTEATTEAAAAEAAEAAVAAALAALLNAAAAAAVPRRKGSGALRELKPAPLPRRLLASVPAAEPSAPAAAASAASPAAPRPDMRSSSAWQLPRYAWSSSRACLSNRRADNVCPAAGRGPSSRVSSRRAAARRVITLGAGRRVNTRTNMETK